MAGAYVAKPAVVSVPARPPGWPVTWPVPGDPGFDPGDVPFPPGYATDYSIEMTVTASIAPTGTAAATSSVRDQNTYATNEPSVITWTATIDGGAINLKFEGGSFASSISESAVFGTYWGTTPNILFDLDDDNGGDTVVLKASCTLLNSEGQTEVLTNTLEITVFTLTATLKFAWNVTSNLPDPSSWTSNCNGIISNNGGFPHYADTEDQWDHVGGTGTRTTDTGDTTNYVTSFSADPAPGALGTGWWSVAVAEFDDAIIHLIETSLSATSCVATYVLTFTVILNGEETIYTKTVNLNDSSNSDNWLTIDGSDGTVTILNP